MGVGSLTEGITRGSIMTLGAYTGLLIGLGLLHLTAAENGGKYGYFSQENSSYVLLKNVLLDVADNNHQTEFSFRTCSNGEFLFQSGATGDYLQLLIINGTLEFHWSIQAIQSNTTIGDNLNSDEWWTLSIYRFLGNLYLNVTKGGRVYFSEIISNSTYQTYISSLDLSGTNGLYVGRGYTGCLMEGPTVIFSKNNPNTEWQGVIWSNTSCPRNDASCAIENGDINACYSHPCINGGTCIDGENTYTCQCPHLFNDTNCENNLSKKGCLVSPCLNGGTCLNVTSGDRNYQCICISGFAGINCEGNIDECGSNPCHNDVPCIDEVGGFECNCSGSGYSGSLCDHDIDECQNTTVCGTGECFNRPGSFSCDCRAGYFGPECKDINECQSNPCQNGATCQNQENRFNCLCVTGYTGEVCQIDIDNCVDAVCGGAYSECRDGVNVHTCVCKPGYSGTPPSCAEIDECVPNSPCRNGATCVDLVNDYNCTCLLGYEDKNCSINIDECLSNPCQNGAICVDHVNWYSCQCVAGYDGNQCQNDINECARATQPCNNGGTCNDEVDGYNCTCALGYEGDICQTDINECEPDPCGVNSTSCSDGIGFFNCTCKPGYSGTVCQTDIDECLQVLCHNGGTCIDRMNGYECTCTPDWMGTNCTVQYDACSLVFHNCKNGATCQSTPPLHDFNCSCVTGFSGSVCETNIDDCASNPCTLPHVCFDDVDSYYCACPLGYEGQDCSSDIDECHSSPCQHGGTCTDEIANYTCQCNQRVATVPDGIGNRTYLTGYEGINCEHDVDECLVQPTVCLNGGDCENEPGTFQCKCGRDSEGNYYSGSHCEVSTSYCVIHPDIANDPPACKNNGTCKGLINDYQCICVLGFEGRRCKLNIDECESNPCQYNGTCVDGINGYTCDCIPGIMGDNCEQNIDECKSNPCLHGGPCIDHINRFDCNCTDTGFKGDTCDVNIDDCEPRPCTHGATCYDLIKDYNCTCLPGYNGKECQNDIDECTLTPCHYGSGCLQKSNKTLYDIDYPGFENMTFSYASASGYICECVPGSIGVNCETNIDDCQHDNCNNGSCFDLLNKYRCDCFPGYEGEYCDTEINECLRYTPCLYGSTCTDKIADYDCDCPPVYNGKPYAGKNCTFELTSCQSHECYNGATCQPYLINETTANQDYECVCTEGFTARYCNISTTMSFDTGSYVQATLNVSVDIALSFRFRTTLLDAILFAWIGQHDALTRLFTTLELKEGNLYIGYHENALEGFTNVSISNKKFNDGEWHKVVLTKTDGAMSLTVSSIQCMAAASDCFAVATYDPAIQSTQDGYFGSLLTSSLVQQTVSSTEYVGCMEDITVWGTRLSLDVHTVDHSFHGLTMGCARSQQCFPDTCNSNGDCVDLWNKYRCDCYRPHLGVTCQTAYIAATFAHNNINSSTAEFNLDTIKPNLLLRQFDLSFFVRTRKDNSLVLFFGNIDSTYVTLELESGYFKVRQNFCAGVENYFIPMNMYSDGEQHLVRYYRNGGNFMFYVDNNLEYFDDTIPSDCNFNADLIYFGGKTPPASSFVTVSPYKGTIQDVQLQGFSLQFYPLSDTSLSDLPLINMTSVNSGLTQGEVSDPVCDMITPCENNSTCGDVFFNDYRCDCLLGYRGKNCSELDFCVTGTCPGGSTCQSLLDGFECISDATFDGKIDSARYAHTLSNTNNIKSFSFKFRTLAMNGYIFLIGNSTRYYKARLVGTNLSIMYKLDDSEEMVLTAAYPVSDSRWYMAKVTENATTVTLTLHDLEGVTVFANESGTRPINGDSLNNVVISVGDVWIGVIVPDVNVGSNVFAYHGCLREFRIGGILLPFFPDDEFVNNTSTQKFLLQTPNQFTHGCIAGQECNRNQCHSSVCVPDFYTYVCNCSHGYTGRWCQDRVDYCMEDQCVHGKCVSRLDGYECQCNSGYSGSRCGTDVDECSNTTACQNNGSCRNFNGTFSCDCPDQFIGDLCEISLTENCSTAPCVHGTCEMVNTTHPITNIEVETFNCSCTAGYEGYKCDTAIDYCSGFPCENGATCVSDVDTQTFNCSCVQGYEGPTCEMNRDDCPPNHCQNNGVCVDGLNSYACNCTPSNFYTGATCTEDIDECKRTQPCQNMGLCLNAIGSPGFRCHCDDIGFTGLYCEQDIDECNISNTCKHGASCSNSIGDYDCNCTMGYKAKDCGIADCDLISCQNGTCAVSGQSGLTEWNCHCPEYYEGDLCEIKGPCADEPCVAAKTEQCSQNIIDNTFECHCQTGWQGTLCNTDVDECSNITLNLCENGATCKNNAGSYTCACVTGYTDKYCQTDINECLSLPCKNDGYCVDGIGQFECNCTGTGFENVTCEVDIDECFVESPCYNGASCDNNNGSFTCQCTNGYEGPKCEVKSQALMEDDITWYIVGPVVALVLILITIGVVWFLLCVRTKRATRGAYSPSRQEVTGSRVELGNVLKKPPLERLI